MPSVLGERATVRVIHVLRKPLSEGTVAANVVKHGCGGLNIDASRVSGGGGTTRSHQMDYPKTADGKEDRSGSWARTGHGIVETGKGRWPANLILQHLDGCRCDGVKKVSKGGGSGVASRNHEHQAGFLEGKDTGGFNTSHYGSDGKESVANWICEPGCPVARLDEQSGVLKSGALPSTQYTEGDRDNSSMFAGDGVFTHQGYKADTGGASRFYKQVGGK